jgi:hypothetical protein
MKLPVRQDRSEFSIYVFVSVPGLILAQDEVLNLRRHHLWHLKRKEVAPGG